MLSSVSYPVALLTTLAVIENEGLKYGIGCKYVTLTAIACSLFLMHTHIQHSKIHVILLSAPCR